MQINLKYFSATSKSLFAMAAFSAIAPALAQPTTFDLCRTVSQTLNKTLPIRKDNVTILRETGCMPGSPKNKLTYVMETSAAIEKAKQIDFENTMKPNVLNTWCSDPQIRVTLNAFDIEHRYYTNKGEYVGAFLMTAKECK